MSAVWIVLVLAGVYACGIFVGIAIADHYPKRDDK